VSGLGFVYIKLCTGYIQVTGNLLSLMHFCVQGNTDLWLGIKKINTALRISKLFYKVLSGYLWFTALVIILIVMNSKDRNTPFMTSIKF